MKFSVIMPVLNGEKFISEAINSIRTQSEANWELLIMDGGSADSTINICQTYCSEDSRISLHSEPDNGMYDALFKGINKSKGDWICWLNSDDLYAPWCFATIRNHLTATSGEWFTGLPGCWNAAGTLTYTRPLAHYSQSRIASGWHHERLLGYLQQESIFFTRSLFDAIPEQDLAHITSLSCAGDYYLWRAFARQTPLQVIPTVLGGFRRHTSNLSTTRAEKYWDEVSASNPPIFPPLIANMLAYGYRIRSALAVWKLIEEVDKI